MNLHNLEKDLRWYLDVNHQGHCANEELDQINRDDENYSPCDHEYNRCYRIDYISIADPSEDTLLKIAELVAEDSSQMVKNKVLEILKEAQQKFDFTDTSNFDWSADRDYYGDSISYVKFSGSLLSFLQEELGKL